MPGGSAPGTSAAGASLHCGLPLRWVVRWRLGFQPPDTATRSHANRSVLPPAVPHLDAGDGRGRRARARSPRPTDSARLRPLGSVACARGEPPFRASISAATATPASARSVAVRNGVVIVGEDHRALARRHAIAVDVSAHRAGQHDAGPVVVAEHDSAARSRRRPAPRAWPRSATAAGAARAPAAPHMVVDPLDRGIGAAVIDAVHGGAPQDAAVRQALQLGLGRLDPVERRRAVDLVALGEQPPAETEILLGQDHPRARPRGGERGRQAGRPAADHQHVAERVWPCRNGRGRAARRRGRARRRGGWPARRPSPRSSAAT